MERFKAPDCAMEMLLSLSAKLCTERVPLAVAHGRVLAEDITAGIDIPPFDRSPFDGYALRGDDTKSATPQDPVVLKITEEIAAGVQGAKTVTEGYAAKILTGAPIPQGADTTVKYEDTEYTEETVTISSPLVGGTNIMRRGEDIRRGAVALRVGDELTPGAVAVSAALGLSDLLVFNRPTVGVISTGTELCPAGKPLGPAMIYNSNTHMISGYLRNYGVEPVDFGMVPDSLDEIAGQMQRALSKSDMIITTGGASVGDYDWAVRSCEQMGAHILFHKVAMKPGGSIVAAEHNGKLILGLSGNPGAAMTGFIRIALPYIKKLTGRVACKPETVNVKLLRPYPKRSDRTRLLRGTLVIEDGSAYLADNPGGNDSVAALLTCDLLGEIPAGSPPLEKGAAIKAYRF